MLGAVVLPGVVSPPTMSLLRTASSCQFSDLASLARWALPLRPCSSPATETKTMVLGNLSLLRTRADSRETATPLASSLAPGAGPWVLALGELREAEWRGAR